MPVLMLWLIRGRIRREMQNPLNWLFVQLYRPIIWIALKARWATIILTLAALVTRLSSLIRNAHIQHRSTLRTAIGIRHARIAQRSQGFMAGSFNTREFFHGASPRVFGVVKWLFLILVFPAPIALLSLGLLAVPLSYTRPRQGCAKPSSSAV